MQHRRILITLLALISTLALISWVQAQPIPLPLDSAGRAATQLLTNLSFETDTNSDKIPDGWNGKKTDLSKADKQKCNKNGKVFARSGNCAFMFKGNPDGSKSKLQQNVSNTAAILNSETLTLSAYVDARSAAPGSKIAMAKVKLSDGSKIKVQLEIPASPASGYSLLSDTASLTTIPNGVTITKAVAAFYYGGTSGKFFVDDASLTASSPDIPTPTETPLPPAQLFNAAGEAYDTFGWSVSVSADGNTAIIGEYGSDVGANSSQGSASVYTRSGGVWTLQQRLVVSDGEAGDQFGWSVSLSADGNTALIGATNDDIGANSFQGSAYIFVRSGSSWTMQQQLVANDGTENEYFGWSVSLSADGSTAIIGVPSDEIDGFVNRGSAYVFVRSGSTWTQQQKLESSEAPSDGGEEDNFGQSVSLSGDGNTAMVGAYNDDHEIGVSNVGSVFVFNRTGGTWTETQLIIPVDGEDGDQFGTAVSLSADGSTALITAVSDDINGAENQGSAYIFIRAGNTWTLQQQLTASDGQAGDFFGPKVSLSGDGSLALVGAPYDDILTNNSQGSAYLFERSGGMWSLRQQFLSSDGAALDHFGDSVSLSADGSTALIGAPADDIGLNEDQGSAWVFDLDYPEARN